jgi:hypothetical protein
MEIESTLLQTEGEEVESVRKRREGQRKRRRRRRREGGREGGLTTSLLWNSVIMLLSRAYNASSFIC